MSEWDHLEIPELQQQLKEAATYQERSAIRKVLHRKQLRGGGGKNIGKAAPSGATVKRRPSRESRSIGVVRDFVRRNSDVADERYSPEPVYTPSGKHESSSPPNNDNETSSPNAELKPTQNGNHQPADQEKEEVALPAPEISPEQEKENVETVEAPKQAAPVPATKPKPSPKKAAVSLPSPASEVQTLRTETDSRRATTARAPVEQEDDDDEDESPSERALEAAIARSSDYNERRDIRAKLRKMRADKRAGRGGSRSRQSQASESEPAPAPVAAAEADTAPEPTEIQPPAEEPQQEPTVQDVETNEETTLGASAEDVHIVVEDIEPESGGAAGSATLLETEDKILRRSVTEPANRYDQDRNSGLAGDEGVSDFRTVLRRSASPAHLQQQSPAKSPDPAQLDFRNVLSKASEAAPPASKANLEAGENKYRLAAPRQEDFRGQLRRKVETKDCSSAAPKRTGRAKQEDFRNVLKKTDDEARSPHAGPTPTASPPATHSPQPGAEQQDVEADGEVTRHAQEEGGDPSPRKSPVPPPVKAKPKVSARPSPVPPEMRDEDQAEDQPATTAAQAAEEETQEGNEEEEAAGDTPEEVERYAADEEDLP